MAALALFCLPLDRPNARPYEVEPKPAERRSSLIYWVDLDLTADASEFAGPLDDLGLPGLRRDALEDWSKGGEIDPVATGRAMNTADVIANHEAGAPVRLAVRPVLLVAGAGWVLSGRDRAEVEGRAATASDELSREDLFARVERRWHPWTSAGADDLATIMLLEIIAAWPLALEGLAARQAELERSYLDAQAAGVEERAKAAATLHTDVALLRRQMLRVDRQLRRVARPGRDPGSAWFRAHETQAEAGQLAAVLDSCRSELGSLFEAQRSTLQLMAGQSAVDQLKLAETAASRGQALQRLVTWLTGLLLVPTLVATTFGALPGILEGCPLGRLALVVGSTLATMLAGAMAAQRIVGPVALRAGQD